MPVKTNFLSLPFELRETIYKHLLCPSTLDILLHLNDHSGKFNRGKLRYTEVILANKQICAEATRVFHYNNVWIRMTVPEKYADEFVPWMPYHHALIESIRPCDAFVWPPALEIFATKKDAGRMCSFLFAGSDLSVLCRYLTIWRVKASTNDSNASRNGKVKAVNRVRVDMRQLGHVKAATVNSLVESLRDLRTFKKASILGLDGTPSHQDVVETSTLPKENTLSLTHRMKSQKQRGDQLLAAGKPEEAVCVMYDGVRLIHFLDHWDPLKMFGGILHPATMNPECGFCFASAAILIEIGAPDAAATMILTLLTRHKAQGFSHRQLRDAYYLMGRALVDLDEDDAAAYSYMHAFLNSPADREIDKAVDALESKIKGSHDEVVFNIGVLGPLRHATVDKPCTIPVSRFLSRYDFRDRGRRYAMYHHYHVNVNCIWQRYRKGVRGQTGFTKVIADADDERLQGLIRDIGDSAADR